MCGRINSFVLRSSRYTFEILELVLQGPPSDENNSSFAGNSNFDIRPIANEIPLFIRTFAIFLNVDVFNWYWNWVQKYYLFCSATPWNVDNIRSGNYVSFVEPEVPSPHSQQLADELNPDLVFLQSTMLHPNKTNSVALSRQANYTDWATATCRRNLVPTFVDRGVSRGQRGGSFTVVNLSFLDRNRYFSFK
jgi:hypothetical protein